MEVAHLDPRWSRGRLHNWADRVCKERKWPARLNAIVRKCSGGDAANEAQREVDAGHIF